MKLPEDSADLRTVHVLPIFLRSPHFSGKNAQPHPLLAQKLFILSLNQILNGHLINFK